MKVVKPILDALRRAYGGPSTLDEPRPLEQLVLLLLARGAEFRKSQTAMKQLQDHYVDWNEVRVTSAYELRKHLHGLGEPKPGDKADQLKELLTTIYNRFNKLDLDFLLPGGSDPESARKRDRFHGWLQEKMPAIAAVMTLYGPEAGEVAVIGGLPRVLQRIGWLNGKSTGVGATRDALVKHVPAADLFAAQWGLYHVLEECCHGRAPACPACPVVKHCPAGQSEARERSGRAESETGGAAGGPGKKPAAKKGGGSKPRPEK